MVVVSRIGVNYADRDASPMRMENQHEGWGGEGYRPFVYLFIYIDMFSSRGGGEAIQCHASRHPYGIGLRSVKMEWKKRRREGEKVIIGGPWRYACGVSLRFLINFYPILPPLLNVYRPEREEQPSPHITHVYAWLHLFSFAVPVYLFIYLFVYFFFFFHSTVFLVRFLTGVSNNVEGRRGRLSRFPANFRGRLSVTSYGNLINSFPAELLPSEAESLSLLNGAALPTILFFLPCN